ncbi:MAG: tetratricopeptide repeat protein [Candidatus Lokiarchaeota archaeon]|nr:tetratricopeptide repeat protein [Candidatus Lokiarchaeota archaeon]
MADRNEATEKADGSLERKKAAYDAMKAGDMVRAEEMFRALSKSYPWVPAFKFNLALACLKQDKFRDALDYLNEGLAIEPDDSKAITMKRTIEASLNAKPDDASTGDAGKTRPGVERNRNIPPIITTMLQARVPAMHATSIDGGADGMATARIQTGYSYSRLMNFIVFEKQRRHHEVRSTHGNDIDDEQNAIKLSWFFSRTDMNENNKPIPNTVVFHAPPKLTGDAISDLIDKIDALPKNEDSIFLDSMKSRFSYEIAYIKEAINELHRSRQYQKLVEVCTRFLEHFPDDLEILFELGNTHMEQGNIVQAEASFRKIIEMYYENAYAWHNLAKVYQIKGLAQFESFCLQKARDFGYEVDEARLGSLLLRGIPVDPFTDNVQWE